MEAMPQFSIVLFKLPDGRFVLQRRTKDAPYAPGKLGIFGGRIEDEEDPETCIRREITEETSFNGTTLSLQFIKKVFLQPDEDFPFGRRFFLYSMTIPNMDFSVYEGDGAEAYAWEQLQQRHDLAGSTQIFFREILEEQ